MNPHLFIRKNQIFKMSIENVGKIEQFETIKVEKVKKSMENFL